MTTSNKDFSTAAKLIHLGLAGFGIAAYLTGELAEGGSASNGYLLHAYLGLSLAAVMITRLVAGMGSGESLGFRHWKLFSKVQMKQVVADLRGLFSWKIPDGDRHSGLAGLVQALGLLIFAWMAFSGTGLFFIDEASQHTLFEAIEEAHEAGESLIPLYLIMHVGAVVLHSLVGKPVWQHMFHFGRR